VLLRVNAEVVLEGGRDWVVPVLLVTQRSLMFFSSILHKSLHFLGDEAHVLLVLKGVILVLQPVLRNSEISILTDRRVETWEWSKFASMPL